MSHEHTPHYRPQFDSMRRAMGREAQDDLIREALRRVDGEPVPAVNQMQVAMGSEGQIRSTQNVIRAYLGEHDLQDKKVPIELSTPPRR